MPKSPRTARSPRRELDTDVISRAIRGSSQAFDRLFDCYHDRVRYSAARAARVSGYRDDIDDLAHEVWCRLLRNDRRLLGYFDAERGPFGPFIGTLAYQQALATIRWYRRQVPDTGLHGGDDEQADQRTSSFAADLIQSDFYTKLLRRADGELGESDRLLLREIHLNQRTCRAVAQELGLNENTIYKRNERLKKKLATIVGELMGTNGRPSAPSLALLSMLLGATLSGSTSPSPTDAMTHEASTAASVGHA